MAIDKTIVCLKWGDKYSPDYVNNLYNMVKRNMRSEFRFVCFTEDTTGIDPEIETKPLMHNDPTMKGWWHKLTFFMPKVADLEGKMLFLDLDVTIHSEIDCLFDQPGAFNIIWEWNATAAREQRLAKAAGNAAPNRYNSSVFMMEVGSHPDVWSSFLKERPDGPELINIPPRQHAAAAKGKLLLHGDQDWINLQVKNANIWPDGWVRSFKYGGLDRKDPNEAKIAVFHGYPDPHQAAHEAGRKHIESPWILSTWRGDTEVTVKETATSAITTIEGVDYGKDAWWKCVSNSVTLIDADHVLGALRYSEAKEKIQLWHDRLEKGKTLNLLEDDFAPIANTPDLSALDNLCAAGGPKSIYTFPMLKLMLENMGFVDIKQNNTPDVISITCKKA